MPGTRPGMTKRTNDGGALRLREIQLHADAVGIVEKELRIAGARHDTLAEFHVSGLQALAHTFGAATVHLMGTRKPREGIVVRGTEKKYEDTGRLDHIAFAATDVFIGDEGRSFGFGDQVADPKPPRAALVKSHGGERCGNVGTMIPAGTVERGERKRTVDEVSKAD
jgi:hypothetical protein